MEYLFLLGGILFGGAFFLLDSLGGLAFLRSGISFGLDPLSYHASSMGVGVREYFDTFIRLGEFREEYNELSIRVYEQEIDGAFFSILKEENQSLRKQIALADLDSTYTIAKTLGVVENDLMRVNRGQRDGVAVGDVVVLGDMYVGIVTMPDERASLVRLPTNSASSLEAVVVSGDLDEIRESADELRILTKAVVKGSVDGIRIENMSMNVSLKNGDIVVVNDPRVGQYLILGYLVGLSENPAATSRSGYVSPILDYDKLITVFVKIDS